MKATKYLKKLATFSRCRGNGMGTVVIGINNVDLQSDIDFDLANYLGDGINQKLNNEERYEQKLVKAHSYMIKDGYNKHTHGFISDNKFIFLASKPGGFFYKLHDYKLTIHLSQWNNIKQVADAFCDIFGAHNTQAIFNEGEILRLDAWIDTNLSYNTLKKTVYRNGVSVSDQRKGDRKTYYLGSKKPMPALFYEKSNIPPELLDLIAGGVK